MSIEDITITEPYKILFFTYEGVNDQGFPYTTSYEVYPSYKSIDGSWVNTSENMFNEDDIKSLISQHKLDWTESVTTDYKAFVDSQVLTNPSLEQQIDEILASL